MGIRKIKALDKVSRKHLKVVGYLVASGGLGYALSLIIQKPELAIVFAPAINYILYVIEKELKHEGYFEAFKK